MQETQPIAAARVFDCLAVKYDAIFTHSYIGRAQRMAVWECAQQVFTPRSRLLELNCGTGEDALHFARMGFQVMACDVSNAMVMEARRKAAAESISNGLSFHVRSTEEISELRYRQPFDGVFSNFSGLNCVNDLTEVANALFPLLLPGAPLLLCFSTRYCLWEIAWYLLRGDITQASRRWSGYNEARISDQTLPVYYPKCEQIRQSFGTGFRLVAIYGIGITVPPSYVEPWMVRHPQVLRLFRTIDSVFRRSPGLRVVGDHMLLHFERLPS
jgi:ubiquinone/menaquinone biosynthesis C-methylase UbiE